MSAPEPGFNLDEVLILAPLRRDAATLANLLEAHGIKAIICEEENALASRLDEGLPAALVLTQEALHRRVVSCVRDHLSSQPQWSELAIIVLVEAEAPTTTLAAQLAEQWSGSRQIFLSRPLAPLELVSSLQSALLARMRQGQVRDHLITERELRHELNHRVKNILASVSSIFEMTVRRSTTLDDLRRNFGGRLSALGRVHAALFASGGEELDVGEIVEMVLSPYAVDGPLELLVHGPGLRLNKDASAAIGLVLHELATNAVKYGAWSTPNGQVQISWGADKGGFFFKWQESGGPEVVKPQRQGYGTRYVRMALQGLFGTVPEIEYERNGIRVEARGQLSSVI